MDGCPCLVIEPCSDACSCARPYMSGGCVRCAKYGSEGQRKAAAQFIAHAVEQAKADLEQTYVVENCTLEVDTVRGVLYVHGPEGVSLVRVCRIPQTVIRPIPPSRLIDITAGGIA